MVFINNFTKKTTYRLIKKYREKHIDKHNSTILSNNIDNDPDSVCYKICEAINSNKPCMISRFGGNELDATINYRKGHPLSFLRTIYPFWAGDETRERMLTNAGFFPNNNKALSQFADLTIDIVGDIDILGSWLKNEDVLPITSECQKVNIVYLVPFWSKTPWTATLKWKKVLVVHPFAESIRKQYERRELLFDNKETLPEFASFSIVKAVQSIGGETNGFNTWFDALHYMEDEIDKVDYDVALIGCGAYGMPLAAHCKKMGKKAVHMGGTLQLLFGIRGNRWETEQNLYMQFMNDYWVRPLDSERPLTANNVENGCYW